MYPYKKYEAVPGTEMEYYGTLAAALLVSWQKISTKDFLKDFLFTDCNHRDYIA